MPSSKIFFTSAKCPLKDFSFGQSSLKPSTEEDWRRCSIRCRNRGDCLSWQYETATKACLILKSSDLTPIEKEGFVVGTRGCGDPVSGSVFFSLVILNLIEMPPYWMFSVR